MARSYLKEYRKAHLFQLMDEHLYLSAGSEDGYFELDGVKSEALIFNGTGNKQASPMIKAGERPFRGNKQHVGTFCRMFSDPLRKTDIIADQSCAFDAVKLKASIFGTG